MRSNVIRGSAALLLALALLPAAARAEQPEGPVLPITQSGPIESAITKPAGTHHPFAALAGNWTGGGMISLTGEIQERLRCRARHTYGQGNNSITLSIRCASDNYKFELTSNVIERRGQLSGQWSEASYNVSGSISGRVAGNRISAVASGDSFNATLTVVTNGNQQSVTIAPQATYVTGVQVALSRR